MLSMNARYESLLSYHISREWVRVVDRAMDVVVNDKYGVEMCGGNCAGDPCHGGIYFYVRGDALPFEAMNIATHDEVCRLVAMN
jgi:hypothetical protein